MWTCELLAILENKSLSRGVNVNFRIVRRKVVKPYKFIK